VSRPLSIRAQPLITVTDVTAASRSEREPPYFGRRYNHGARATLVRSAARIAAGMRPYGHKPRPATGGTLPLFSA
jgi:hypothetical protein